jgi:hypothetical protein
LNIGKRRILSSFPLLAINNAPIRCETSLRATTILNRLPRLSANYATSPIA